MAFGIAHLEYRLAQDPGYQSSLKAAIEERYEQLASSASLNEDVFDALILLAAGSSSPDAIRLGFGRV